MNEEFEFKVYSQRWGHYDTYKLTRIETGWYIEHITIKGDCDPEGKPYLIKNFEQDSISYPSGLPSMLGSIWRHADEENLKREQIQEKINELTEWISLCEKKKPSWVPYY